MKKKLRMLADLLVLAVLMALGVLGLGGLLRPVDTDSPVNAIHTFHRMPENSLEVIGYGSSHMWLGLDPMELYREYGIGAYNYGCNWQALNTTLLFLKDSLRTQNPKVVVVDTFHVNEMKLDMDMDGEIYYTRAIPWFSEKLPYLRQCFGARPERYLSYALPLVSFHGNWENLTKESFRSPLKSGDNYYRTMGFSLTDAVVPVTVPEQNPEQQLPLYEGTWALLEELVEVCRERDIAVVFCTIPWQGQNQYSEAMTTFALEKDCPYLNLFDHIEEIGLDGETDFMDSGHLNTSGAQKIARYLGAYLRENYALTDFRESPGNLWDRAEQ